MATPQQQLQEVMQSIFDFRYGSEARAEYSRTRTEVTASVSINQATLDRIRDLVAQGADLNTSFNDFTAEGRNLGTLSPLVVASLTGNAKLVNLLLELGATMPANPNDHLRVLLNYDGKLTIERARAIINLVVNDGADVNIFYQVTNPGHLGGRYSTPLHYAVMKNDPFLIRLLYKLGAHNLDGRPLGNVYAEPLMFNAIINGCVDALRTMLELGADPEVMQKGEERHATHTAFLYPDNSKEEKEQMLSLLFMFGARPMLNAQEFDPAPSEAYTGNDKEYLKLLEGAKARLAKPMYHMYTRSREMEQLVDEAVAVRAAVGAGTAR